MSLSRRVGGIDNQTAQRLKRRLAEHFRDQLAVGIPTNEDEAGLRRLAAQIKTKKVVVKLLRHTLQAFNNSKTGSKPPIQTKESSALFTPKLARQPTNN